MGARKGSLEHLNALLAAADDNRKSLSLSGTSCLRTNAEQPATLTRYPSVWLNDCCVPRSGNGFARVGIPRWELSVVHSAQGTRGGVWLAAVPAWSIRSAASPARATPAPRNCLHWVRRSWRHVMDKPLPRCDCSCCKGLLHSVKILVTTNRKCAPCMLTLRMM